MNCVTLAGITPARAGSRLAATTVAIPALALILVLSACDRDDVAPEAPVVDTTPGADSSGSTDTSSTPATPVTAQGAVPTSEAAARATTLALETLPRPARTIGSAGMDDGRFQLPFSVAVDATGTVYVGDSTGLQVFDPTGAFLRRIGAGELTGVEAVAVRPDGSRVYAAHQIGEVVAYGADGVRVGTVGPPPAGAGEPWSPDALAVDAGGQLFVGDTLAGTVEVFDATGGHVRTILGRSGEPFSSPRALAFDAQGRLYVGLGDDFLVQRFTADGTYIDSFGHSYSDETMFRVGGIAVDDAGAVYVTRSVNQYVQVIDAAVDPPVWRGDFGGPGSGASGLSTPTGIAVLGDELFVADQNNHRIQVFQLP